MTTHPYVARSLTWSTLRPGRFLPRSVALTAIGPILEEQLSVLGLIRPRPINALVLLEKVLPD